MTSLDKSFSLFPSINNEYFKVNYLDSLFLYGLESLKAFQRAMRYALMRFSDDIEEEKLFLRWVGEVRGVRWGCPGFHRQLSLNPASFDPPQILRQLPTTTMSMAMMVGLLVMMTDHTRKMNELR